METLLDQWALQDPTMQTALLGALAGLVAWLVQFLWTHIPGLPGLAPDTTNVRKWVVAVLLAVITAAEVAQGDGNRFLLAFLMAIGASQASHNTSKVLSAPNAPAPDDLQSTVDDDG